MKKSLLCCFEKFYSILNEIIKKTIEVDEVFFQVLKECFESFEKNAAAYGFYQADIQLGKYALVALVDELISRYYPNVNHHWPVRSLQLYYYQSNIAGNLFFENLDNLLVDQQNKRLVLEVYYVCLSLEFKGRYRDQDELLEEYRRRVRLSLEIDVVIEKPIDFRSEGVPVWALLTSVMILMLILYAVFIVCVSEYFFVVENALSTYAEQLQHV